MKTTELALPTFFSHANRWCALRAFVHDQLADACHHPLALQGARPTLRLLVSRRHLQASLDDTQQQLDILSSELVRMAVRHTICQVVTGDPEPASHQLWITLQRP